MDIDEFLTIAGVEFDHWWYRSLHELVINNIKKHFSGKDIKIIDAGCGTGGLLYKLARVGYKNLEGFDISDVAVSLCKNKGLKVFKSDLRDINEHYQHADVLISNDTLYFLNKDEQHEFALNVYNILDNDGIFILNLPSLKAFRGIHDIKVDIKERFNSKDINRIFDENNYKIITKIYWPFLLSPLIVITRFYQRMKLYAFKNNVIKSDIKKNLSVFNKVLYLITKFENSLFYQKPFGSSMFLVIKKN